MVASTTEQVWGIPRASMLEQVGEFQGFRADDEDLAARCRDLEPHGSFRPRDQVEDDPHWKQVIPYLVLRHRDRVLRLRRLSSQGESRLHHRNSIGVGGHVNPEPAGPEPLLMRGMRRELAEEVRLLRPPGQFRLLGWINDDETDVGRVHLGMAIEATLDHPPEIRETDRMEGLWLPLTQLCADDPGWESWSALLIPVLEPIQHDPAGSGALS